ncbi:SacI homology domain-containing protein [Gamsiella multidivaricata]|uniref:SacI homology domain-containing protein n=1 Tax=Gamsiella multidivaricata TaxID=101098 RepID=UPI00221F28D4|nr:SacI homology domain-containing protein [Gamsiella multidivaricata]KAG0364655.1 hypothetical protein BGZ54_007280 [Gamsiella multidivaricata]KAI7828952.1 SacI homology domain-containing protein [Gamsiella multidivaricata]
MFARGASSKNASEAVPVSEHVSQAENGHLPPNTTVHLHPQQLRSDSLRHPAHPFARIQLTVEPDSFVLQPYHGPVTEDDPTASHHGTPTPSNLVQVHFRRSGTDTKNEESADVSTNSKLKEETVDNSSKGPLPSLLGPTEGQQGRVSYLNPGSYTRSEDARDYIIYGCIGLLDLYTGPHFIVITSVKPLGNIEDKPVYAINKVAVLPMVASEACRVLDKLAQYIDPSTGSVVHTQQASDQQSNIQEPAAKEEAVEEITAPVPVAKPPKIKFAFLSLGQDKDVQKSTSASDLPSPASPLGSKRVSFDIPRLGSRNKSSTDLPTFPGASADTSDTKGFYATSQSSSPKVRSSQPGFFAKLRDNVLEKQPRKSVDGTVPPTLATDSKATLTKNTDLVNNSSIKPTGLSQEDSLITAATISEGATDEADPEKNTARSPLPPGLPSAYEAAEKFVVQSTKQIVSWSEEAVSGVLKSSMSSAPAKPVTVFEDQEEGEQAHVARDTGTDQRALEEEQEKERILDRRVIREISSIFGTGFYFSNEFNLLSSKQKRSDYAEENKGDVPLWQQVDRSFWWNEHLLQDFLDIKADGYILPVMQGYVEIEPCEIEEQPFEFTLISRRSRERSGLRYQRRGIDENGNAANFVETEQLLRIVRNDSDHQVSFVQTRGSIPLFWSQSPYRLKPIPIMERSEQENKVGFKKHVDSLLSQYGRQIFINLVEQHGRELIAGSAYTHYVKKLAEPQIRYVEFDFHEQCKGMKYENIDQLIQSLEGPILELGYCWLTPKNDNAAGEDNGSSECLSRQKGVIRTNCMDCLDRTNVVQSAIGRYILNHQLLRLGIASFPDKGLSVYEDFENVFNNVWANNGDAISREYAGTSALKGDFTRTGKRNLQGMINDATNSMARMYQNTFKDYFRQAAIDYLLGAADVDVFKSLQTTTFGTAIVPSPILPPPAAISELVASEALSSASTAESAAAVAAAQHGDAGVLLPSLMPQSSSLVDTESSASVKAIPQSPEETALQQETWVKIREAAIETSAEIVISPGEERWKGWTFICCSNEISSSLASASSPQSSPQHIPSAKRKKSSKKNALIFDAPTSAISNVKDEKTRASVFYDEKVILLTERALYICTYDYEMEKVVEFWRLALEKMTGIDKGAYFLTAQDTSRQGQDPLENYGFAVEYRASAGGETLRVNIGSVRNRRIMGVDRTPLVRVAETEEEDAVAADGQSTLQGSEDAEADTHDDSRLVKSLSKDEPMEIRSVRFKVVKHPETSIMPYVTSSGTESGLSKANPSGYKRTAQDCVEWVVTEIVQARCELISTAERGRANTRPSEQSPRGGIEAPSGQQRQGNHHGRSPSEEYNYQSPKERRRSSVQVDLLIRDRVLQSLEATAQREKELNKDSQEKSKKFKRPFSGLFQSSKTSSKEQQSTTIPGSPDNNKSWLKKLQLGQDSSDESSEERTWSAAPVVRRSEGVDGSATARTELVATDGQPVTGTGPKSSSNSNRNSSGHGVFAKFKQAVKNL